MKTRIAILMMAFGFLLTTTAFANEPVPASKAVSKSVATYIENNLDYPEFAIENKFDGDVVLSLIIEDDGSFDVVAANCVDQDMKNHVVTVVEEMQSDKHAYHAGQKVNLKIKFDLLLY